MTIYLSYEDILSFLNTITHTEQKKKTTNLNILI